MIRIGIGSWTYPWSVAAVGQSENKSSLTAEDIVCMASDSNIGVVQLCDNIDLMAFSDERLEKLNTLAAEKHVTLQIGFLGISRVRMAHYMRIAQALDASIIRVVTDYQDEKPSADEIVEMMRSYKKTLEEKELFIAIENHDRFTAEEYADMFRRIGSEHVGICLDTTNSLGKSENYALCFDTLKDYILNFHFKDYGIRRVENKMGFIIGGAEPGKGCLDADRVIEDIKSLNRNVDIILEQWPPFVDSILGSIENEQRWAKAGMLLFKDKLGTII